MPDLILHHYAMSPFSEKIRTMLGYAGLEWASVTVPEMPPRPKLTPLAGGYRKIPVAQIGADVFCDTRTITSEIAQMSGKPELALENTEAPVREFVQETDLAVFLACVLTASDGGLLWKFARQTSLLHTLRFLRDRIAMGRGARVKPMGKKQAKARVKAHLADLEHRLEQDFLFSGTPCIADFSAYHGLWFLCDLAGKDFAGDFPRVKAWMGRMRAFGHGRSQTLSPDEALDRAKQSTPHALAQDSDEGGKRGQVAIAPADYGLTPTQGEWVAQTPERWIIRRETPQTSAIHLHFPREGFTLTPV